MKIKRSTISIYDTLTKKGKLYFNLKFNSQKVDFSDRRNKYRIDKKIFNIEDYSKRLNLYYQRIGCFKIIELINDDFACIVPYIKYRKCGATFYLKATYCLRFYCPLLLLNKFIVDKNQFVLEEFNEYEFESERKFCDAMCIESLSYFNTLYIEIYNALSKFDFIEYNNRCDYNE